MNSSGLSWVFYHLWNIVLWPFCVTITTGEKKCLEFDRSCRRVKLLQHDGPRPPKTSLKHCFKLVSLWVFREWRGFHADPPVLLRRHMLPASSAAHLIWREGGADGGFRGWVGGGGERTLRTKGYTELSLCVCALYSVCFSFSSLLRVAVGRHACVHGFLISSSSSSSCVERKTQNMQENSAKQRDFLCNM